jgi:hypothetical protein
LTASVALCAGLAIAALAVYAQEQSALYVFATDAEGIPILDLTAKDLSIREDKGESTIVSVQRYGWPLKVTVLLDNGPGTAEMLVHYRTGLQKFFKGLPPEVPVSLIATAPNPRWLVRETRDRVQIEKGVGLITPESADGGLARFSDALIEYSRRLDEEFRNVSSEQLPPYLPVLVSISTTNQDGSHVQRETNLKMITSLRKHRVWTNFIVINPSRAPSFGDPLTVTYDDGQVAEIAKVTQDATGGRYVPIGGSATSSLSTTLLPQLAADITLRYIKQMTQHRVVLARPEGASGPMKNFKLELKRPKAQLVVTTDGIIP